MILGSAAGSSSGPVGSLAARQQPLSVFAWKAFGRPLAPLYDLSVMNLRRHARSRIDVSCREDGCPGGPAKNVPKRAPSIDDPGPCLNRGNQDGVITPKS